jgi:hypothetical protein
MSDISNAQKSVEILRVIAEMVSDGRCVTFEKDWGFGSGTIVVDGSHTHVGGDYHEDKEQNFDSFVDELHGVFVRKQGLSFVANKKDGKNG